MNSRLAQIFALLFIFIPLPCPGTSPDPCDGYSTALLVDTVSHTMWMCQGNLAVKEYHVSLGRGGVDKRVKGDGKTPLGEYPLGLPRPSDRYGVFIPVGYPSPEQLSQGFSGGNIGIHGPHRRRLWLGEYAAKTDWTLGCIAVGTDDEIAEVARWVKAQKVDKIVIR